MNEVDRPREDESAAAKSPSGFRASLRQLQSAQKTSKGAPAYSRYINRPLGRVFAAGAHVIGATPNQVTVVSGLFTFTGIAVVALIEPSPLMGVAVVLLLALGYALDAADGQLSRLRGTSSVAGEWLDHCTDAVKNSTIHLAVLISWYRFGDGSDARLLIPIGFQAVDSVLFFATMQTDHVRRRLRGQTGMFLQGQGNSSIWYSLAVAPTDYGVQLLTFALIGWQAGFAVVYTALFALTTVFLLLALPKWFLELRAAPPPPAT